MAIKDILLYPQEEKALRKKSKPVKKVDAPVQALIRDLKETLLNNPGAGLAAPQIGVHKRVVVVRFGQESGELEPPLTLVNPVILEEGPLEKGFDGCLSLPGISTWDTKRPVWLRFRAQDEHGKPFEMKVEGIDSILVHHEIDHLNGVMFLDRLEPDGKLYISVETEEGEKLVPLDQLSKLRF